MPTTRPQQDSFDERGRMSSPFIERDGDGVPRSVLLPDMASLNVNTPEGVAAVDDIIQRFAAPGTAQAHEEATKAYLARFGFTSSDPRYAGELDRLTSGVGRSALGQARDLERSYSTVAAFGGDLSQKAAWVTEGDDSVCDGCDAAADTVNAAGGMVYSQWPSYPGGDTCYGGSLCRCQPVIVGDMAANDYSWVLDKSTVEEFFGPAAPVPEGQEWAYDAVDEMLDELWDY